ncbi:MAG: type II secretion system minor pseudopilin GspI [Candidatus Thiodiazotropha sp. (ex Lucinoma kastoroae)]|nr:type II secretion system minor pseudopilin GspI [Candidatus Thiodiazotropha sp. (ex Rostrolucina anterorostrata)]MCU7848283.1 type II secretion system minor pseudopilin GspI [Candidatus Thiodiazotropha sp. (ex Lucinoma kastoroae)]MCU7859389.1 type II secretion system minor pseudopilin GspI [Candidatus Thiodiazotropha sp. (ex Lucinoma kastoroae)]
MSHPIDAPQTSVTSTGASHCRGFTLLEILIALAILTIAFASIITVSANQSVNVAYLRDKTLAHWVAMNQMTELQISKKWLSAGKQQGDEEMGLHKWHWVRTITNTPDDRVRQVEFTIFRARGDEHPVTRLVSFLSQPGTSSK